MDKEEENEYQLELPFSNPDIYYEEGSSTVFYDEQNKGEGFFGKWAYYNRYLKDKKNG